MATVQAKATRNGQMSLPAELRHRWVTASVLVIDRGGYAIVRPTPVGPPTQLRGAHAGPGPSLEQARAAEAEHDERGNARR